MENLFVYYEHNWVDMVDTHYWKYRAAYSSDIDTTVLQWRGIL